MKKIIENQDNDKVQIAQNELLGHNNQNGQESHQILEQNLQKKELNQNHKMQQEQVQQQYDEYGDYDEYGQMMSQSLGTYERRISSEVNSQCQMEDLVKIIERQTQKVMELSGFDYFWALIYYQTCGWRMNLVSAFIDEKKSSHHIIHYKPGKATISNLNGICDVCCLEDKLIYQNICGDQYCEDCWKGHLQQRLQTFYSEPFPPCLNSECLIKTSPFILDQISKNDSKFKKLYSRTLCRSYAIGNPSVKMCKGRQKFSCDRCFKVHKLMQMIECQCCGNFVCARCGEQYHFPSECFEGSNWRKVVQQSTNFIQTLNYRVCPFCKQAVERSVGCNSVVCKCKQTFCYICGQKWLPNHSQHGVCYRQKQIRALQDQRRKKTANQKEYIDKLQKFKAQIENYIQKIKKVNNLELKPIKDELTGKFKIISNELDYLEPLRYKLNVALLIGKNYVLSLYFNDKEVAKAELANLTVSIQNSYDFLLYTLQDILDAYSEKNLISKRATQIRKSMRQNKFNPQQYLAKCKIQMLQIMRNVDKYLVS